MISYEGLENALKEKGIGKPELLMREVSDNKILQVLREEKEMKLSEDQTRMIFETNTLDVGEGIPVDDVLETVHHFRAIDYVIDTAEDELTEEIIKHLHYIRSAYDIM